MLSTERVEWFSDREGRGCLVVAAPPGTAPARWAMVVSRGPRTLAGACAQDREALARCAGGFGSFGIVEDDATRRALATALAAAAGTPALARLRAMAGAASLHCALGDLSTRRIRSLDGRCGRDAVDALAVAHPHLMPVVGMMDESLGPDEAAGIVAAFRAGPERLREALRLGLGLPYPAAGADPLPALLRSFAGLDLRGFPGAAALRAACRLPADWVPGDEETARAFAACALVASALVERSGGALSLEALLGPSRGRWVPFLRSLAAPAGPHGPALAGQGEPLPPAEARADVEASAGAIAGEVADMVSAFVAQCAAPCVCHVEAQGADRTDLEYAVERLCLDLHRDPSGLRSGAWRLLLGGKGLPAVLKASSRWHARRTGMEMSLRSAADPRRWSPPVAPWRGAGGLLLRPIASAAELAAEGAAMHHCVGGYVEKCLSGDSVVLSVLDGRGGRSSTVEMALSRKGERWRVEIVQHRSARNAPPPPEDAEAVADLARAIEAGRHPVSPVRPPRGRPGSGRIPEGNALADACGYDWLRRDLCAASVEAWSPFLPRGDGRRHPDALARGMALSGRLLDLPAARAMRRAPSPPGRVLAKVLDVAVPVLGIGFMALAVAEAARTYAGSPLRPAVAATAPGTPGDGDAAVAATLRRLAKGGTTPCPGWAADAAPARDPAAEGLACGARGGLVAVAGEGIVVARLEVGGESRELFRMADGHVSWPSGEAWRGWLASAAGRDGEKSF